MQAEFWDETCDPGNMWERERRITYLTTSIDSLSSVSR
jgi:hypothetical protein